MKQEGKLRHPAVYSDPMLPIFADLLQGVPSVLDPFAGTGKLARIKLHGFSGRVICNEIEPEWAHQSEEDVDQWIIGDAQSLPLQDSSVGAICTSPTYGNRMADSHNARDASRRITYTHCLGRTLNPHNSGQMQWGDKYRDLHQVVYSECYRVVMDGGFMIVNISNHIRKGVEVDVTKWHIESAISKGFILAEHLTIPTRRMRFGANGTKRAAVESILVFHRGKEK